MPAWQVIRADLFHQQLWYHISCSDVCQWLISKKQNFYLTCIFKFVNIFLAFSAAYLIISLCICICKHYFYDFRDFLCFKCGLKIDPLSSFIIAVTPESILLISAGKSGSDSSDFAYIRFGESDMTPQKYKRVILRSQADNSPLISILRQSLWTPQTFSPFSFRSQKTPQKCFCAIMRSHSHFIFLKKESAQRLRNQNS